MKKKNFNIQLDDQHLLTMVDVLRENLIHQDFEFFPLHTINPLTIQFFHLSAQIHAHVNPSKNDTDDDLQPKNY